MPGVLFKKFMTQKAFHYIITFWQFKKIKFYIRKKIINKVMFKINILFLVH